MLLDNDIHNLLRILGRGTYQGLEEAEVATVLAMKLNRMLKGESNGDSQADPKSGPGQAGGEPDRVGGDDPDGAVPPVTAGVPERL